MTVIVAAVIVAAALVFHGGCVLAAAGRDQARPLAAVVELADRVVKGRRKPESDDEMRTIGL